MNDTSPKRDPRSFIPATEGIWIDSNRQGGSPCIKGTRISVRLVLRAIEHYGSIEAVCKTAYPDLTEQNVKDALYYAQESLNAAD